VIFAILVGCGIAYNVLSLIALMAFRRQRPLIAYSPPVSILKPVRGRDAGFYDAIRSHAAQPYHEFELLFGAADPDDPAIAEIERLKTEFPDVPIRVIHTANDAPNGKVGSLEILEREARYETLLVNDGDIVVPADYLQRVIGPLADPQAGLVTCLYRGRGASLATEAEALGIATEFMPSVLVARLLSSSGFALGATMAFRKADLAAIGGFAAIREYLADDYQLGARIAATGKKVLLADTVVTTNLGAQSWRSVWKHQVRWSRTIRVSRPAGYFGYVLTQLTFWSVMALGAGWWKTALAGLVIRRLCAGIYSETTMRFPVWFRDLFGMCVWIAGLGGNYVEWRGLRFRLLRDGRIRPA
jgi:ceramide glucosyltransferase